MPRPLLKNVHSELTRHGKRVYYFRRERGERVRLPALESPVFRAHYDAAMNGRPIPHVRDMPVSPITARKQRVEAALASCLQAARSRSKRKGVPFDLTFDWLLATAKQQDFRCKLTGIEFYATPPHRGKVNPYAPSLDRIEPAKGYVTSNVRIVLRAVNTMLLDWGPEVFKQVADSYRYWEQKAKSYARTFPSSGPHLFKEKAISDA